MLTWMRTAAVRLSFAVLALLLGPFAPAYAGPTSPAPAVEVQPAEPEDRLPLVTQVYLLAYRAHGPPSGAFIFVVVHASRLSAGTSYDANGNTVRSSQGTDAYTTEDRIRSRTRPDGTVMSIAYDGDGVKVAETVGGVTTWFLVDQQNPTGYSQTIEEIMNGAVVRSYLWGQALAPLAQTGAEGVRYFGTDGHGSVRYLTDALGSVTDTMDHDAYGVQVGRTGTTDCRYGYSGYEWMEGMGQYYVRARTYNPESGRFGTMDHNYSPPNIGSNLYSYCDNSPSNGIDPTGYETLASVSGGMYAMSALRLGHLGVVSGVGFAVMDQLAFGGNAGYWSVAMSIAMPVVGVVAGKVMQRVGPFLVRQISAMGGQVVAFSQRVIGSLTKLWKRSGGAANTAIGDIGERMAIQMLQENGYSGIMAIKNTSQHGLESLTAWSMTCQVKFHAARPSALAACCCQAFVHA